MSGSYDIINSPGLTDAPMTQQRITICVDGRVFETLVMMAEEIGCTVEEYVVDRLIVDGVG